MDTDLGTFVAILVPIALIQLSLVIWAFYDLTRPNRRVKGGSKVMWGLIVVFLGMLGPILYFVVGREEA